MEDITKLDDKYQELHAKEHQQMVNNIYQNLKSDKMVRKAAETIVETAETERLNKEKDSIEGSIRDHLRGFSRTIPAFLMAYGDEKTTLSISILLYLRMCSGKLRSIRRVVKA